MATAACKEPNCPQGIYKDGWCIDHYRKHKDDPVKAEVKSDTEKGYPVIFLDYPFDPSKHSYAEITEFLLKHHDALTKASMEKALADFKKFDEDNDAQLTYHQMTMLLESLGMQKTHQEMKEWVREVDLNKNGTINFFEYVLCLYPYTEKKQVKVAAETGIAKGQSTSSKAKLFEQAILKDTPDASNVEQIKREAALRAARKKELDEQAKIEEAKKKDAESKRAQFKTRTSLWSADQQKK